MVNSVLVVINNYIHMVIEGGREDTMIKDEVWNENVHYLDRMLATAVLLHLFTIVITNALVMVASPGPVTLVEANPVQAEMQGIESAGLSLFDYFKKIGLSAVYFGFVIPIYYFMRLNESSRGGAVLLGVGLFLFSLYNFCNDFGFFLGKLII